MDKYLHAIEVITNDDESKDSKETDNKSQPYLSKDKEKDYVDINILTKSLNALTNEVLELKRQSCEASTNSNPPKYFPFIMNTNNKKKMIKYVKAQMLCLILKV